MACDIQPLVLPWSNITVSSDGLAVTRGIEVGIGTPNQIFSFRPDTTINNTRIYNVLDCGSVSNTSCVGGKGGVFDSTQSSTYVVSIKDRWNGSAADAETATGSYVYFNDLIDFQKNGTIEGFPLVMDSELNQGLTLLHRCPYCANSSDRSSEWPTDGSEFLLSRRLRPRECRAVQSMGSLGRLSLARLSR